MLLQLRLSEEEVLFLLCTYNKAIVPEAFFINADLLELSIFDVQRRKLKLVLTIAELDELVTGLNEKERIHFQVLFTGCV